MTPTDPALRALDAAWAALADCGDDTHGDSLAEDLAHHRPFIDAAALAAAEAAPLDAERLAEVLRSVEPPAFDMEEYAPVDWMAWAEAIAEQYAALAATTAPPTPGPNGSQEYHEGYKDGHKAGMKNVQRAEAAPLDAERLREAAQIVIDNTERDGMMHPDDWLRLRAALAATSRSDD